jgi:hypothetical protein
MVGNYYTSLATIKFKRTLVCELRAMRNVNHQRRHSENVGMQTWTTISPFWLSQLSSRSLRFRLRYYVIPFFVSFAFTYWHLHLHPPTIFPCPGLVVLYLNYVFLNHIFSHGSTALVGLSLLLWGSSITLRHTTFGTNPPDEWSARRRDLYLTTHNTDKR